MYILLLTTRTSLTLRLNENNKNDESTLFRTFSIYINILLYAQLIVTHLIVIIYYKTRQIKTVGPVKLYCIIIDNKRVFNTTDGTQCITFYYAHIEALDAVYL